MGRSHALLIPFPAQGHVKPLMDFAHRLAEVGFKVTFVNTEFIDARIRAASRDRFSVQCGDNIRLATIPDGTDHEAAWWDFKKLTDFICSSMPACLEELITKINEKEEEKITCVIADGIIATLLCVAEKLNLKRAVFWPASAWLLATVLKIPMMVAAGDIDENGYPKNEHIKLSDLFPAINPDHLCWIAMKDLATQVMLFHYLWKCAEAMESIDHIACNTSSDLESPYLEFLGNVDPIGLLSATNSNLNHQQPSSFWQEDWSCLEWLDQQSVGSVVYVALGSVTTLSQNQIDELVLGLELTGMSFLLVYRPGLVNQGDPAYPRGFLDRVAGRGHIVRWAPQEVVLSHPSIACFVTHCGWNSTTEGISNGIPMLCWPYVYDQFQDEFYIVKVWKVGLSLEKDVDGIVKREEVNSKVEALISDQGIRERVLVLKEKAEKSHKEGGDSFEMLLDFVNAMKGDQ